MSQGSPGLFFFCLLFSKFCPVPNPPVRRRRQQSALRRASSLSDMRARGYHLVLAVLSVAPHVRASNTRDPSHSLRFRQALPRPSFGGTHHRLRGGASSGKPIKQTDPALKPAYAAYVVAWAVLPTLLRLAVAAATMAPPPPAETEGWLAQLAGWVATTDSASTRPSAPVLPFPKRWQLALAAAWVANNLAVVVPGRYGPPISRYISLYLPTSHTHRRGRQG